MSEKNRVPLLSKEEAREFSITMYYKQTEGTFYSNTEIYRSLTIYGLKSMLLLNGGGVVGLLTFMGHIWQGGKTVPMETREGFKAAMACYALGVIFDLISIFFSWIAALITVEKLPIKLVEQDEAALASVGKSMLIWRTLAVAAVIGALLAFGAGSWNALMAFP